MSLLRRQPIYHLVIELLKLILISIFYKITQDRSLLSEIASTSATTATIPNLSLKRHIRQLRIWLLFVHDITLFVYQFNQLQEVNIKVFKYSIILDNLIQVQIFESLFLLVGGAILVDKEWDLAVQIFRNRSRWLLKRLLEDFFHEFKLNWATLELWA